MKFSFDKFQKIMFHSHPTASSGQGCQVAVATATLLKCGRKKSWVAVEI